MMSWHTCVISYSTIITLSSEKWPARTQTPPASSSPPWQWGGGGAHRQRALSIIHSLSPQSITLHVLYIYRMAENTCPPLLRTQTSCMEPGENRHCKDAHVRAHGTRTYAPTPSSRHAILYRDNCVFLIPFRTIGFWRKHDINKHANGNCCCVTYFCHNGVITAHAQV